MSFISKEEQKKKCVGSVLRCKVSTKDTARYEDDGKFPSCRSGSSELTCVRPQERCPALQNRARVVH